MTSSFPRPLIEALDVHRRGDPARARAIVEAAFAGGESDPRLRGFAGLLACQQGEPAAGIPHLQAALAAEPGDVVTRLNLASALLATGDHAQAAAVAETGPADEPRLLRIIAYARQQLGQLDAASTAYERVLAAMPGDFESWSNLGNVHAAAGDHDRAIVALERAIALQPRVAALYANLGRVLMAAQRYEEAAGAARAAVTLMPDEPDMQVDLALAEAANQDFAAAEAAFRAALAIDGKHLGAYLELGILLENLNRIDDLVALADAAQAQGLATGEVGFLRAWALRRQGEFAAALPLAEATPATISPVRRAQLIAQLADRLGDTDRAFDAFADMNRAALAERPDAPALAADYLAEVEGIAARTTPAAVAKWRPVAVPPVPPAPVFVVGFPRSGTTLLDTLLMNLPALHVAEEQPLLHNAERELGPLEQLGETGDARVAAARARYFATLAAIQPGQSGQLIIDKHPLHMARVPIVHRLFPDARFVFVERHPYDAVLSCFMANFQLNRAMANFTTLEGAARLYDAAARSWQAATASLPVAVHRIRYERMVTDLAAEMQPLIAFLGLDWDPAVLDNRGSAARRGHIRTASYAQVGEAIYDRASGRWERYRAQLAPVLPVLAPWVERMGYAV